MPAGTHGLCAELMRNDAQRKHRRSRKRPAFPAQWFDGLCRALPGEPSSVATVALRIADEAGPVGRAAPPQDLTPASGARTARFCRTRAAWSFSREAFAHGMKPPCDCPSRATLPASTASRTPRIVTTRTPLPMRRDGGNVGIHFGKLKAEYFLRQIWTGQIRLKPLADFGFSCKRS